MSILILVIVGIILIIPFLYCLSAVMRRVFPSLEREIDTDEEIKASALIEKKINKGELDRNWCYVPCRHLILGHLAAVSIVDPDADPVYLN